MNPSPVDVIAQWLDDQPVISDRHHTAALVAALEAAGYRIVSEQALYELTYWSREDIDTPYVAGWIAGWYETHVEGRPPYSDTLHGLPADSPAAARSDHPGTQTPDEPCRDAWPPPKPGTHESDLYGYLEMRDMDPSDIRGYLRMRGLNLSGPLNADGWIRGGAMQYIAAADWSRAHRQS